LAPSCSIKGSFRHKDNPNSSIESSSKSKRNGGNEVISEQSEQREMIFRQLNFLIDVDAKSFARRLFNGNDRVSMERDFRWRDEDQKYTKRVQEASSGDFLFLFLTLNLTLVPSGKSLER